MYLNYKYTSYTEVGKAGIWPRAKFLHYSLFSRLLPPFPCCILVLCHLKKHPGMPLYFQSLPAMARKKSSPPYIWLALLEVGCHTCLPFNEWLSSMCPRIPDTLLGKLMANPPNSIPRVSSHLA